MEFPLLNFGLSLFYGGEIGAGQLEFALVPQRRP